MTATESHTSAENSPTLAMRRLGARLRRHREAAGLTREDAAAAIGAHYSKIYRIEAGRSLAKLSDVKELARSCDVSTAEFSDLVRLVGAAKQRGLMDGYRDVVSGELSWLADLESVASEVFTVEVEWMPALVQSPVYSWAILGLIDLPDDVRRKRHEFRAARQKVLLERKPRVDVRVVIGEAALRYAAGGNAVMRGQFEHLRSLAGKGVDIRIRPFSAGVHRWMAGGPFTILNFSDAADPAVVYTEGHLDSRYQELEREVVEYRRIFGDLHDQAIPVKEFE
jgi:transcriptional regulator with XRE-family HTH domain